MQDVEMQDTQSFPDEGLYYQVCKRDLPPCKNRDWNREWNPQTMFRLRAIKIFKSL